MKIACFFGFHEWGSEKYETKPPAEAYIFFAPLIFLTAFGMKFYHKKCIHCGKEKSV